MKVRKVAVLFLMLTVFCLAGCGKKTPAEEPSVTPTATPGEATPTTGPEGTPTPVVTEGPDIPEGTPLERLITGLHNAFADGNVTVSTSMTATNGTETETRSKAYRFVPQEDGELIYIDETFTDASKQHEFLFYHEHGGIHMWEWWENTKMVYEFEPIGEEDAKYMYPLIRALREPGDEAFRLFVNMLYDIFPDMPKTVLPKDTTLMQLLAPIASEENLEKTLSYHQTEDGADVYVIHREQIASFVQSVSTGFAGMRYYLGDQQLASFTDATDVEIAITYANACVDTITVKFGSVSNGSKAEYKIAFSNVGTSVINIPTKKAEEFEKRKFNTMGEEPSNEIGWVKQYVRDALEGRVDKDVETINDLLHFYNDMLSDPEVNATVKEIIGKEEYFIYYSEGSNYDKAGIEILDKKLKEKYGAQKLQMVSVMWTPLDFQIILMVPTGETEVKVYWQME